MNITLREVVQMVVVEVEGVLYSRQYDKIPASAGHVVRFCQRGAVPSTRSWPKWAWSRDRSERPRRHRTKVVEAPGAADNVGGGVDEDRILPDHLL